MSTSEQPDHADTNDLVSPSNRGFYAAQVSVPATGPERPEPAETEKGQVIPPTVSVWRLLVRPRLAAFLAVSAVFSLITPVLTYAVPMWISQYAYPHDAWPVGILVATNAVV